MVVRVVVCVDSGEPRGADGTCTHKRVAWWRGDKAGGVLGGCALGLRHWPDAVALGSAGAVDGGAVVRLAPRTER
jgi:hypothetical protein